MSRIIESATSETVSSLRRRRPLSLAAEFLPPSLSGSLSRVGVGCKAGTRPKRIPVMSERPKEYASTEESTVTTVPAPAGPSPVRSPIPHDATMRPSAPPIDARSTLSVSNCRRRRPRLAPRAVRMAISLRRVEERANCRLATFAQAISSKKETAPNSSSKTRRISPTICSCNGVSFTPNPVISRGYSRASRSVMTLMSCSA